MKFIALLHICLIYCSVIIAKLKRYIIVVGIPLTAAQIANKFIGSVNIKGCADASVNSSDKYDKYNNNHKTAFQ